MIEREVALAAVLRTRQGRPLPLTLIAIYGALGAAHLACDVPPKLSVREAADSSLDGEPRNFLGPMTLEARLPLKTVQQFPVKELSFDPRNPRRGPEWGISGNDEVDVIKALYETADLTELLQSIASSGYVNIEPLVVLIEEGNVYVLEGNRRLAALRVLTNPDLAAEAKVPVPTLAPGAADTLNEISVYRVASREDARDFIGFKHINGTHAWDSLAKARYAAQWYRDELAKSSGVTLADIARRMGDRHDTIKRMVAGIYVLEQGEQTGVFEIEDRWPGRQFAFSHLYTALTRPGYREYLGLADNWRTSEPSPNPVAEENLPQLGRVLTWLYGSKSDGIEPVVKSQNPHVKELGEVLQVEKSRLILESTGRLDVAYKEIDTVAVRFERNLVDAHTRLKDAASGAASGNAQDDALYQIATEVRELAEVVYQFLTIRRK